MGKHKQSNRNKVKGRSNLPRLGGRATMRHDTRPSRKTAKQNWKRDVHTEV